MNDPGAVRWVVSGQVGWWGPTRRGVVAANNPQKAKEGMALAGVVEDQTLERVSPRAGVCQVVVGKDAAIRRQGIATVGWWS